MVGTPVVSTRASLSPPSPTPTRGSDGIERLAVLLKDSIMSSMEARLSKVGPITVVNVLLLLSPA